MKTNLKIEDYEDKKTTAGKRYTRFKTSDGWMSCFDSKATGALKGMEGKEVSVEVKESDDGKFKNIHKYHGEATEEVVETVKPGFTGGHEDWKKKPSNSHTTMYVSYAKDIFNVIQSNGTTGNAEQNMELSIKLVKQAKQSFE